ncbi:MAG: hypothetical protein HYS89_02655 [Candidatus Colwellbacteria bacterium]|nr:hypothetical protein [Candidatus Colwellbacteria bacterium]
MNHRLYVNKSDKATSVISKVIKSASEEVLLYIPRQTEFASSRNNFALLKREAETAGKKVSIESVDDDVLELATTAGLVAMNPFLGRRRRTEDEEEREAEPEISEEAPPPSSPKRFVIALTITVFLAAGLTFAATNLARANIKLVFEKLDWDFVGTLNVAAGTRESSFSGSQINLRGARFTEKKNLTKSYPAHGTGFIERKAKGRVTIYNAYDAQPQTLVVTTRLEAPDGRIYRIDNEVTVPGAKVIGGEITPVGIEVSVTADKAGPESNLTEATTFRIPGFEGSPRYNGFYAESKGSITGGAIGDMKSPTDEDIRLAKVDAARALEEATRSQVLVNLPPEVKILDGAYEFALTDETVDETVDASGNFSVTVYGEGRVIGFREPEIFEAVGKKLEADQGFELAPKDYKVEYSNVSVDFENNVLTAAVSIDSVWTRPFDAEALKLEARGKNETDLRTLIFGVPGVESGEVRLWPFWTRRVPDNTERIIIDVE